MHGRSKRLFLGTAVAPTPMPSGTPEPNKVDLWTYRDDVLQSQQRHDADTQRKRTYLAVYDLAAARSCPWAKIKNMIGGSDRFFVVLDHDHGIAEIAQSSECSQKPRIVALMQSDARLVKHIQDADEPRPDLRGQPDALRLTTRQGAGRTIE